MSMLNAKEIIGLVPQGGSLVLSFTLTKDGMAVLVNPRPVIKTGADLSGAKDAIEAAMQPRVVRGTADELDAGFMGLLTQVVASQNSLLGTISEVEAATKEAIEKVKKEGAGKVEAAVKTATAKAKATAKPVTAKPVTAVVKPAVAEMSSASAESDIKVESEGGEETGEDETEGDVEPAIPEVKVAAAPQVSMFT